MTTLTPLQVQTIHSIVNIYETGAVLGVYSQVTLIKGDTGGLTYGRSQTTLMSGNLAKLIEAYLENAGSEASFDLKAYLPRIRAKDETLNTDPYFSNLLRAAADQPVMRQSQDRFFDSAYWDPAHQTWLTMGGQSALGAAIIYDSWVHGSFALIRKRTDQALGGSLGSVAEKTWMKTYVSTRKSWLAENPNTALHATVYRMNAFEEMIAAENWDLALPMTVRGQTISVASLAAEPPGVFDGPQVGYRTLVAAKPWPRGCDVRQVQSALSKPEHGGADLIADGIYGPGSAQAVHAFQSSAGLGKDGHVGEKTYKALGLL